MFCCDFPEPRKPHNNQKSEGSHSAAWGRRTLAVLLQEHLAALPLLQLPFGTIRFLSLPLCLWQMAVWETGAFLNSRGRAAWLTAEFLVTF